MNETHFKEIDLLLERKFELWAAVLFVSEIYSVDADELRDAFDERNKNK